jgi:hypothetical protein
VKLNTVINNLTNHSVNLNWMENWVNYVVNCISVIRFGVNTSTTNKYENKVMIILAINTGGDAINGNNNVGSNINKTGNISNETH